MHKKAMTVLKFLTIWASLPLLMFILEAMDGVSHEKVGLYIYAGFTGAFVWAFTPRKGKTPVPKSNLQRATRWTILAFLMVASVVGQQGDTALSVMMCLFALAGMLLADEDTRKMTAHLAIIEACLYITIIAAEAAAGLEG